MNTPAPRLSPLFRSDAQAEILARLILNPDRSYTTAELARVSKVAYATAHREVQRLVRAGLLTQDRVGQTIRLSANRSDPAFAPVAELLRLSYGPAVVVPRVLAGVDGIQEAYIYGSWAARRTGEPGSAPGDIDVLVIGDPRRDQVHEAAGQAERILGREVNIRIVSAAAWQDGQDMFITTVKERPRVRVDLKEGPS